MAELDRHLLAPARLKLTTMLTAASEVEFAVLRAGLGVSDSLLSEHVATLTGAGYVRSRKGMHEGRRTTTVSLSPTGRKALRNHVAVSRPASGRMVSMPTTHGTTADGTPITEEMIETMADDAERGYDVEAIMRRRQGGRPPMGSAASSVESVRLDPELKRDLLLRAAEERISVSEAIRRAIGQYLRAS